MDSTFPNLNELRMPTTEEELQAAIASLKASTRAAERRTKIVTSQGALADRLGSSNAQIRARWTGSARHMEQRATAEVQHVKFVNEQLRDSLRSELQIQRDGTTKAVKAVPAIVTEVLNTDDRVIAELNDLSAISPQNTTDISSTQERLTRLTKTLRQFRAQAIKDRLDRTYLESLEGSDANNAPLNVDDASATDVQEDLGSLYRDVDDVVTMVVSQEHAGGIERTLQDISEARERDSQLLNQHVHGILTSLADRIDILSKGLGNLQSQRVMSEELSLRFRRLESASQAERNPEPRTTIEEAQDGHPALDALLEHLGCSQDPSVSLQGQMELQVTRYAHKADSNVGNILKLSQDTPEMTRAALRDIAAALASNSSYTTEVEALQRSIDAAKMDLEKISI
ncbi:hypothetical protein LTR10_024091 [Elasticomyces elasticus]|uniref:Uncharacterized protein n=1 Tax=Exophiala sideris TaxID=1016849 RepID=A0ABR0J9B7_9EURO|nr:hypothetical protein LTR10_024091 [Elasticomyces elasticus]KAK5027999.1 hypothetical protein LTS07_006875 [Exophiala sideris]KAK5037411.1 hypothetical protein LTR13_004568 [Exophiala sideris]KAK5059073.1 hypothetical protein LTR69_006362 [Exophiala sideris]KAK5182906.1 hypothetical protein LTR44_004616 [Eurotiomycetes sp. CCFEE 6388]